MVKPTEAIKFLTELCPEAVTTSYALLALPQPRRLKLLSLHQDSGRAFIAYRLADPSCLLVRLDDGPFAFMVLAAKGLGPDEYELDAAFRGLGSGGTASLVLV
jgi:hypothetical protein